MSDTTRDSGQWLTSHQGLKIADNHNSLKGGPRGSTLFENQLLREKITAFDHERIPERVVHARGAAAHRFFQICTAPPNLTKARFLNDTAAKTPVFVRFSALPVRAALQTPPETFGVLRSSFIPKRAITIWWAITSRCFSFKTPSSPLTWSTRQNRRLTGRFPGSYRMVGGFGVHSFRMVNAQGISRFVKFHWKPLGGVHGLARDEAQTTKLIPEEMVPVRLIGKLTLNRNPDNYFAETEQVAFHTGNLVPGIDVPDDPLLQGRMFSYLDTHLTRLAILAADGVDAVGLLAIKSALLSAGVQVKVVSTHLGELRATGGAAVKVDDLIVTMPSIVFDSVVVPGGADSVAALKASGDAVLLVRVAFKHAKPMAAPGDGRNLLLAAGVLADSVPGPAPAGISVAPTNAVSELASTFLGDIDRRVNHALEVALCRLN